MAQPSPPQHIIALADERAAARAARDYRTADELKARIEVAGWKVIDFGTAYDLEPARPADIVDGEHSLYGSVASVPSRLDDPATTAATVVVVSDAGASPAAALAALVDTAPAGTQVLLVQGPGATHDGPADEVIRTAVPFGSGDALQAGIRRARGEVVVVLEPERIPRADIVSPLLEALGQDAVAIAAAEGLTSTDLHRYQPAGDGEATTVASGCYAVRRADLIERGPIDGHLRLRGSVAAWLGLLLRDEGPDHAPRRVRLLDLPLGTAERSAPLPQEHARLARRDGYRIARRFRGRPWLAGGQPPQGRLVGDGPHEGDTHDDHDERDHAEDP